jgi:predicted ATPase/DNA-binding SARP family transcriptional activator
MDGLWRVELLGGLRAQCADRTVTRFRTQQTAALLAYLAYHLDRPHPHEVLAEMLWPWASPAARRESLNAALASLQRQMEPPGNLEGAVVKADPFSVQLDPQAVTTDVSEFRAALQAAERAATEAERLQALSDAVGLYRGPLLPGHHQEWVPPEQERLADLYLEAVLQLTKALEEAGEPDAALDHARRAIVVEPLREEGHREAMRLLIAARQPEAALRQYHELAGLLKQELGEEPSEATQRLVERLEAAKGRAPAGGDEAAPPAQVSAPPTRKALPTGTVTFLLTDIEGSTRLREETGDAFEEALTSHHRLLRQRFRQHGGHEVKELGDGFVVAFEHPTDALACAVASQRGLAGQRWPDEVGRLRVRMAVHTGQVELREREYRGLALHYASRVLAAGHGGQILCSEGVSGLLRRDLEPGVRLVDLGVYQLRDVGVPERLFQVSYPGMEPAEFPPLRAQMGYGSHLPLTFTRFFGREKELAWLQETLARGDVRLVTMTGPGGSGKTRLALEAARRLLQPFGGAVWFVPLQELTSAGLIPGAIADALELPRSPVTEPLDQAVEVLLRQPSLLVLDNFEHLAGEGALVVRTLLERVATLTCLVTSRQTLDLSGEAEFFVAPLSTPRGEGTPETLMGCESVQLFVDRAQAARPDFQVTSANALAVSALCDRLEGIPLALELAGARAQVLTPAQMLGQLERRFEFLVSRKRDVPDRHRTLRAAMDWSYQSLPPELQRFFRQLSVFRGGWTVEAAETICEEPNALEFLERLRECSLILLDEGAEEAGEVRFGLLETLREFAQERLAEKEAHGLARRHAQHYLALAEEADARLAGPEQRECLDRLEREHDNLRAALTWFAAAEDGAEAGLRLTYALSTFWQRRGYLTEGRGHLDRALRRPDAAAATQARARALRGASFLADTQADYAAARELAEESLSISRGLGDAGDVASGLIFVGNAAVSLGRYAAAKAVFEEALGIWRDLGRRWDVGAALNNLGAVAKRQNDYAAARALYEEALGIFREQGDQLCVGMCLYNLADLVRDRGEYADSRGLYEASLELFRELGDRSRVSHCLMALGRLAADEGDHASAVRLYEEALTVARDLGLSDMVAWSLRSLGRVAHREGDFARARALCEEAAALCRESGDRLGVADCLLNLACTTEKLGDHATARGLLRGSGAAYRELGSKAQIASYLETAAAFFAADGEARRAARLLGAAEALREEVGSRLSSSDSADLERDVAALRADLGEEAFAAAWAEGRAMACEDAVDHSLQEEGPPQTPTP